MKPNHEIKCAHEAVVDVAELKVNPKNPNRHPESQIALLAKNIRALGWRHPVIVSKRSGMVVAGHARIEAARLIGCQSVPVDYQDFESDAEETAYLLADNRIAELAERDDAAIKDLLAELDTWATDMELTGYDDSELEKIMTQQATEAPDRIGRMELQPFEKHDYIMLMFDNSQDFSNACERLGVEKVEVVYNAKCRKIGLGRVIAGKKIISLLEKK